MSRAALIALPAIALAAIGGTALAGTTDEAAPSAVLVPSTSDVAASSASTAPACRDDDVRSTVILQPDDTNGTSQKAILVLANAGAYPCSVDGWAAVSLVNAANEVVDVPTARVDQPGAPVATQIQPGGAAFAGIKWQICAKSDASCGVGNTLRVSLQASTDGPVATLDGFGDPARSAITMASLQIGSLQPSRQGVVAW